MKCMKCGKDMVERSGAKGSFLGCSGFPDCRNTIQIPKNPEIAQPQASKKEYKLTEENIRSNALSCAIAYWGLMKEKERENMNIFEMAKLMEPYIRTGA